MSHEQALEWKFLNLKLPQATFLISSGSNIIAYNFGCFAVNDVNADKLPLETEPVACDNNTS